MTQKACDSRFRPPTEDETGRGLSELPPNIPPGFLGEKAPDMMSADGDGPHGLNAGVIQEWTWETTMIIVLLTYVFFFPAAFVILWRSARVPRSHKIALTVAMVAGIGYVAFKYFVR